ncbi:hypothetical protein Tco_1364531, partial [Tanacetum coccineum]
SVWRRRWGLMSGGSGGSVDWRLDGGDWRRFVVGLAMAAGGTHAHSGDDEWRLSEVAYLVVVSGDGYDSGSAIKF